MDRISWDQHFVRMKIRFILYCIGFWIKLNGNKSVFRKAERISDAMNFTRTSSEKFYISVKMQWNLKKKTEHFDKHTMRPIDQRSNFDLRKRIYSYSHIPLSHLSECNFNVFFPLFFPLNSFNGIMNFSKEIPNWEKAESHRTPNASWQKLFIENWMQML